MATLKYLSQYFSTTLNVGGGIDASQTTGIILQSVSGVHDITEPGQICVTYSDPIDTSVAEWIDYTSINGSNELVGAVRGREGFSAHAHLQGATVAFVLSASHHNDVVDAVKKVYNETTDTLLKASAAEVATGTDDTKIVTPLAAAPYANSSLSRQAIINGNFDVWQRGTSIALTAADGYTADRWYAETATATTDKTISQQDGTGVEGSRYCLRYLAAQDVDALNTLSNALETLDSIKFRGKKLTLSFYARGGAEFVADNATLISKIVTGKGTDQKVLAFTTSADGISQNNTLTTSWVKFTCTTSAVIASDITQIGVSFAFTHAGAGVTTNYFEITQVQLCAGDVALPFQPKSFDQELMDCMRYYEKSYDYGVVPLTATSSPGLIMGKVASNTIQNTEGYGRVYYKVKKRNTPTPVVYPWTTPSNTGRVSTSVGGTDLGASSGAVVYAGDDGFIVRNSSGGTLTTDGLAVIFHYTVDAEL